MYVPCPCPWPVPLPSPQLNILGFKVSENDRAGMINMGANWNSQNYSQNKLTGNNNQAGDWNYSPIWWGPIYDPDVNDTGAGFLGTLGTAL